MFVFGCPGMQRPCRTQERLVDSPFRSSGGLFWLNSMDSGESRCLYLPDYFHAFREFLKADLFCHLIGNQAATPEERGEIGTARELYREAQAFGNPAVATIRVV